MAPAALRGVCSLHSHIHCAGTGAGHVADGTAVQGPNSAPQLRKTSSGTVWLSKASATPIDLSQAPSSGYEDPLGDPHDAPSAPPGDLNDSTTCQRQQRHDSLALRPSYESYYSVDDSSTESPKTYEMSHVWGTTVPQQGPGVGALEGSSSLGTPWADMFSRPGPWVRPPEMNPRAEGRYERDTGGTSRLHQTASADSWLRQIRYARVDLAPGVQRSPQPACQTRQPLSPDAVPLSPSHTAAESQGHVGHVDMAHVGHRACASGSPFGSPQARLELGGSPGDHGPSRGSHGLDRQGSRDGQRTHSWAGSAENHGDARNGSPGTTCAVPPVSPFASRADWCGGEVGAEKEDTWHYGRRNKTVEVRTCEAFLKSITRSASPASYLTPHIALPYLSPTSV